MGGASGSGEGHLSPHDPARAVTLEEVSAAVANVLMESPGSAVSQLIKTPEVSISKEDGSSKEPSGKNTYASILNGPRQQRRNNLQDNGKTGGGPNRQSKQGDPGKNTVEGKSKAVPGGSEKAIKKTTKAQPAASSGTSKSKAVPGGSGKASKAQPGTSSGAAKEKPNGVNRSNPGEADKAQQRNKDPAKGKRKRSKEVAIAEPAAKKETRSVAVWVTDNPNLRFYCSAKRWPSGQVTSEVGRPIPQCFGRTHSTPKAEASTNVADSVGKSKPSESTEASIAPSPASTEANEVQMTDADEEDLLDLSDGLDSIKLLLPKKKD